MLRPCKIICADGNIYVTYQGIRIAKRGDAGTPEHRQWISLLPGFQVWSPENDSHIVVEKDGIRIH